jgi:plastocyanin
MKCVEVARTSGVRPRRPNFGLLALALILALATACGSGSGSGGGTSSAPANPTGSSGSATAGGGSTVEIENFMFMPKTLTVPVGTTVTWKFDDSTQHTVAANDNSFTSSALANGQTYTHTFTSAGTVEYHCSIHPFMTGTIVVR